MSNSSKLTSFLIKPVTLTQARTLTDSDSGKTYFLNSSAGMEVTLPSPRGGLNFEFILKTVPVTTDYIIAAKSDEKIIRGKVIAGNVKNANDAESEISGASNIRFITLDSKVGDSVKITSDGTYWYVIGFCYNYNGIAVAEQSKSSSTSSSISPSAS